MQRRSAPFRLAWALAALAALALGATTALAQEPRTGGTLDVAISSWPTSLDPLLSTSGHDRHIQYNVYNTLTAIDANMELGPELARSWETPDATTIILELQDGVVFHDGTPFDAEVVRFNIERMLEHPQSARTNEVEAIESVEVLGTHRVQINLSRPEAGLLLAFADRPGMMVSPAAVEGLSEADLRQQAVGTGPFRFVSAAIDDHVRVERNEDYWEEGLPYLDVVNFRVVLEEPTKIIGLRTGDLDIIDSVPASDADTVARDPDIQYFEIPGTGTRMMAFALNREEPLQDKRVRQALSYAIDRDAMIQALQFGQAVPARGPFAPTRGVTYHPDIDRYTYDPERARELLEEAGYPDGFDMTIDVINRTADRAWAEAIQGFYADVGVNVTINPEEQVSLNQKWLGTTDFPSYIGAWGAGAINPDADLVRAFYSEGWWNHPDYANPEVDALIEQILETFDQEERGRLYREVQELIVEDAPRLFMFHDNLRYATRGNVHGFEPYADWAIRVKDVWIGN
jgi:peptide/nickel transport system substrate-binding protein